MEIFSGFFHFLDHRRRPLNKVIPCLDELRTDPASVLQFQEVIIPSAPLLGWSLLCAFWVFIPLSWCVFPLFWIVLSRAPKEMHDTGASIILGCTYLLAVVLTNIWMRRRQIVLRFEGVEFHRKTKQLYCPWSLFRVGAWQVSLERERVRMAIDSAVIGQVELRDMGSTVDTDKRRTSGTYFEGNDLVVEDCFQASGVDVAHLIYEVAWKMKSANRQQGWGET